MIYTITFNPALDISGTVDQLIPDEKSYVYDEIHTPGGNGINAAIIAHRLKAKVRACGFLGGANGEEIKRLLSAVGVKHQFTPITGHTRMNLTVSNRKTNKQTRLSFPGPQIQKNEFSSLIKLSKKLKDSDLVVIGGSLPPGISGKMMADLILKLKSKGTMCLVDMPGKHLCDVLNSKPDFIKPNLIEFQDLMKSKVSKLEEIMPLVRKLNKKIPLVCVSSVEGGAILVSKDEAWYGRIPEVKIRSSVGAGDSMVGAISATLQRDAETPVKELLRWGLAAACATLTEKGMTLGSEKSINKFMNKIYLRKIQ